MASQNNDAKSTIFRKESLERLSSPEQLDQLMQVVTIRSWFPLLALGTLVGLGLVWSIVGRIPVTVTGQSVLVRSSSSADTLVGVSYFETGDGEKIEPGMPVLIIPNTSDRMGGLMGTVMEVSEPPVMTLDAARQVTDMASFQPDSVEVLTELKQDSSTASGYEWSSMSGRSLTLVPGTTAIARVTLEEKAPIAFVFPFLDRP